MGKYREYKFKQVSTGSISVTQTKDVTETQEQITDMYGIPYRDFIEI